MQVRQPRYSKEEHAQRGHDLYEHHIRPHVEASHTGKIIAMDVDTGVFEIAEDTLTAAQRLLVRVPEAQIWCVRIGHRGVYRFGRAPMGARAQ